MSLHLIIHVMWDNSTISLGGFTHFQDRSSNFRSSYIRRRKNLIDSIWGKHIAETERGHKKNREQETYCTFGPGPFFEWSREVTSTWQFFFPLMAHNWLVYETFHPQNLNWGLPVYQVIQHRAKHSITTELYYQGTLPYSALGMVCQMHSQNIEGRLWWYYYLFQQNRW